MRTSKSAIATAAALVWLAVDVALGLVAMSSYVPATMVFFGVYLELMAIDRLVP